MRAPPLQLYLFPSNVMSGTFPGFAAAVSAYCPSVHSLPLSWPPVAVAASVFLSKISCLFSCAGLPNILFADVSFITSFHILEYFWAPR